MTNSVDPSQVVWSWSRSAPFTVNAVGIVKSLERRCSVQIKVRIYIWSAGNKC